MGHSRFLAGLILAALFSQVSPFKIFVEELEDKVLVNCNTSIRWVEGTMGKLISGNTSLDLGKRALDPRGVYMCEWTNEQPSRMSTVQVYYRMCQNCVELDSTTLAGIVFTDIIATLLLALGVYCFAGHETGRLSRAADTQVLLRNDQLYQPLRDRNNAQYSHLGENWHRNK
ncbi:T-Cell Surface Glycoprotein Cd3 Delta Chain [Manis pentadactyla]|nr:T-Cell Surface Glycoprotein Cd3 Delta Chain [Manis pentadactyla]